MGLNVCGNGVLRVDKFVVLDVVVFFHGRDLVLSSNCLLLLLIQLV